jgi:hypothetical protein
MKLLAWLLHIANTDVGMTNRSEFYALKERLLRKYGRFAGHQIQEIKKPCWGPWGDEYGERKGCQGEKCPRCRGTGVFDFRWVRLERWEWAGYVFHRPVDDSRVIPSPYPPADMILGRIEHKDYGRAANEARLWLYLICGEWRLFGKEMKSHAYARPGWWPLTNLQRPVMHMAMVFHRATCSCGRRYWTYGGASYKCYCPRCMKRLSSSIDTTPF